MRKWTRLLLQGRLQQGEGLGDVSHDFLGRVGPLQAEQHGAGDILSAGSQLLQQRLQPRSVPAQCLHFSSYQPSGKRPHPPLSPLASPAGHHSLGSQLPFLHLLLRCGILLRLCPVLAPLGVVVQDGRPPNGASPEHAEICRPPLGRGLSLSGRIEAVENQKTEINMFI